MASTLACDSTEARVENIRGLLPDWQSEILSSGLSARMFRLRRADWAVAHLVLQHEPRILGDRRRFGVDDVRRSHARRRSDGPTSPLSD